MGRLVNARAVKPTTHMLMLTSTPRDSYGLGPGRGVSVNNNDERPSFFTKLRLALKFLFT